MAALAHDVKTPLTIIKGNGELLEDSQLAEEQQNYCSYILSGADEIENYIELLLEVYRRDSQGFNNKKLVRTESFLENLKKQMDGLGKGLGHRVLWKTFDLPEKIFIDESSFHRALINVFSNAVDFSPEGEPIEVTIVDYGKGFTSEAMCHGSEQFFMGDKSRKKHYGLGFYIVDTIVKQHKGSLEINVSPITKGGLVKITIPNN